MARNNYDRNVFINCPFDSDFRPLLHALVFAIQDCGFVARAALETQNFVEGRFDKIVRIIKESRLGFHDLSRVELDKKSKLPRFNMPLELGLFIGAHRFGGSSHQPKECLVTDSRRYRYQKFVSDVAGQDPTAHNDSPEELIRVTRNWLRTCTKDIIPGERDIVKRFHCFQEDLPAMLNAVGLGMKKLTFPDYTEMVRLWIERNRLLTTRRPNMALNATGAGAPAR
jgi:hypothetical protein